MVGELVGICTTFAVVHKQDARASGGEGSLSTYDKEVLKRINDIEHLPNEDKQHIFYLIDNLVKAAKLKTL